MGDDLPTENVGEVYFFAFLFDSLENTATFVALYSFRYYDIRKV
jgi:hypothetical protein